MSENTDFLQRAKRSQLELSSYGMTDLPGRAFIAMQRTGRQGDQLRAAEVIQVRHKERNTYVRDATEMESREADLLARFLSSWGQMVEAITGGFPCYPTTGYLGIKERGSSSTSILSCNEEGKTCFTILMYSPLPLPLWLHQLSPEEPTGLFCFKHQPPHLSSKFSLKNSNRHILTAYLDSIILTNRQILSKD